ncbi:MAG: hypothetical protein ACRDPT_15280 [Streptomycetales bacterium]
MSAYADPEMPTIQPSPRPWTDCPATRAAVLPAHNATLTALTGFHAARARLQACTGHSEAEHLLLLADALRWAYAADRAIAMLDGTTYLGARAYDRDGRVLVGLHYVRTRCADQWALAIKRTGGRGFPRHHGRPVTCVWRGLRELPAPSPGHSDPPGRTEYATYLAGHAPRGSLDAVARWFGRATG